MTVPNGTEKNGAVAPETREASSPPRPADLELEAPDPEPENALETSSNPYHFVAFWQDANEERDFGLRFEPEDGPREFIENEVERLEIEATPAEIQKAVRASFEAFRSTYSKRTGRKQKGGRRKTRGSSLNPRDLTEELVAWLRKDLARLASRPRAPSRAGLRNVDEAIKRSQTRARNIDKRKGGSTWQPRRQLPKHSPG